MLDINSIPMGKIIEMELDTGFMLADVFDEKDGKENPWAKLVFAYLNALSAGKNVSWQEMKSMSSNQVAELVPGDVDDPKEVSESDN
jgi:hypothetical protein